MNLDRGIMLIAGTFVELGLLLAITMSIYWLILPFLAGLCLLLSGMFGVCPMSYILKKLGVKPGQAMK